MAGEREPPAGEVGGEKRGEEAGEPPPDRGSDTIDIILAVECVICLCACSAVKIQF